MPSRQRRLDVEPPRKLDHADWHHGHHGQQRLPPKTTSARNVSHEGYVHKRPRPRDTQRPHAAPSRARCNTTAAAPPSPQQPPRSPSSHPGPTRAQGRHPRRGPRRGQRHTPPVCGAAHCPARPAPAPTPGAPRPRGLCRKRASPFRGLSQGTSSWLSGYRSGCTHHSNRFRGGLQPLISHARELRGAPRRRSRWGFRARSDLGGGGGHYPRRRPLRRCRRRLARRRQRSS